MVYTFYDNNALAEARRRTKKYMKIRLGLRADLAWGVTESCGFMEHNWISKESEEIHEDPTWAAG